VSDRLSQEYRTIASTFCDEVLQLVLALRYLERLIINKARPGNLTRRVPDIMA
jgi:hypothetical protein